MQLATLVAASGWPGTPSPRGAHTSTLINKKIYVFGGYGGMGYGRRDLDDLHSLDTETWKWTKVRNCEERSDELGIRQFRK